MSKPTLTDYQQSVIDRIPTEGRFVIEINTKGDFSKEHGFWTTQELGDDPDVELDTDKEMTKQRF